MRILYRNMGFGGGAPKSLLEYAKVNKSKYNNVLVAGEYTFFPDYYHKEGIETVNIPYFILRRPIRSLKLFVKTVRLVKKFNPDIIHVTTLVQCLFHKIISIYTSIPTIYMIPGGGGNRDFRLLKKLLGNDLIIVYTPENYDELIASGFVKNQIKVIPNRFDFTNRKIDTSSYESFNQTKVLITSRIVQPKISSIYSVIDDFSKAANELKENSLKLDIIGNGNQGLIKNLENHIKKCNDELNGNYIEYHGYQKNVDEMIKKSHICIGKGRSIVDPIMHGRLAFVYNEDGNHVFVDKNSIPQLFKDNFTARSIKKSTNKDLLSILKTMKNTYKYTIEENFEAINELYNIDLAKDKIDGYYSNVILNFKNKKFKLFHTIFSLFKLYFWYVSFRIVKKRSE